MRNADPTVPKGSLAHLDCRMLLIPTERFAQVAGEAQVSQDLLSAVTEHSRKKRLLHLEVAEIASGEYCPASLARSSAHPPLGFGWGLRWCHRCEARNERPGEPGHDHGRVNDRLGCY